MSEPTSDGHLLRSTPDMRLSVDDKDIGVRMAYRCLCPLKSCPTLVIADELAACAPTLEIMHPTPRVALVTGSGSGAGRAIVLKLAVESWCLALTARRTEPLAETIVLARTVAVGRLAAFAGDVGDVGDADVVRRLRIAALTCFGRIYAVVAAVGTNTPHRNWAELTLGKFRELLAVNLHGAFHFVQALLPGMRQQGGGIFVFINPEAGLRASPKTGVAYSSPSSVSRVSPSRSTPRKSPRPPALSYRSRAAPSWRNSSTA